MEGNCNQENVVYQANISTKEGKSNNKVYIRLVGFLGFYGISTFVGYLMPNPFLCK